MEALPPGLHKMRRAGKSSGYQGGREKRYFPEDTGLPGGAIRTAENHRDHVAFNANETGAAAIQIFGEHSEN